jgi:hypothetical protein
MSVYYFSLIQNDYLSAGKMELQGSTKPRGWQGDCGFLSPSISWPITPSQHLSFGLGRRSSSPKRR